MSESVRILVVEDNPADTDFIREILPRSGPESFHVESVARLSEVLRRLSDKGIDLILLDLGLPDSQGLPTLRQLHQAAPDVPIIILTGTDDRELGVAAVQSGAQDYLVKGQVNQALLVRAIRYALERHKTAVALRESELKYRNLFEGSRDALVTVDPVSGRFTSGNPAARVMFGIQTEAELTARGPADFSPERQPDGRLSADHARKHDETAMGEGSHFFEWAHRRRTGEEFFADVLLTRIERDGKPAILATVRDITERKLAEQKLRESASRHLVIFNHSPLGIVMTRLDNGRIVEVNAAFAELYGYTCDELVGRSSMELNMWPVPAERNTMINRLRTQGRCADYEIKARKKSGEIRDQVISVELIELSGEQFTLGLAQDITERKRIEASHAQLATFVEQAAETIVITDLQGSILYANPAFEKTSGYPVAEALGRNPRILKSGKHDGEFYRQMWAALGRGEIWSGHIVNQRKNGTLYEEEASISPVRDTTGNTVSYVAVKRDVTREVQLEAQYRQAQKMEAIGTLAGGIAHDFNNILAAMFGFGYLLQQDSPANPRTQESVDEILKAANRAKDLVQQILTFSRQREQVRQVLRLDAVVKEATKFLRASLPARIKIELELAADTPAVLADPTQIYQVTMNLGTNALHAMEGNPGQLTVKLDPFLPDPKFIAAHAGFRPVDYARLTIADTGAGMSAATLQRIFDPFFTTKPVGKGTGLGLAVVHGIVQSHDGVITVASEVGRGTTFCLYFPAQLQPETKPPAPPGQLPFGEGQRILLLDDETVLTLMFGKLLRRLSYEAITTTNPGEAIRLVRENPMQFDLVITDMNMPDFDGLEVARQIRRLRPDLPVVLASGHTSALTTDVLREAGICDLLAKPVSLPALAYVVHRHLPRKGGA